MFKKTASVLIEFDNNSILTWRGEMEKAIINSTSGLMIVNKFFKWVFDNGVVVGFFGLEPQLSESAFWMILWLRFGFVWIRQNFAEFQDGTTMLALGVALLAVGCKPESLVWTTFGACSQGIGKRLNLFQAQFFFPNPVNVCAWFMRYVLLFQIDGSSILFLVTYFISETRLLYWRWPLDEWEQCIYGYN